MERRIPVPGGHLWTSVEGRGDPVVFISGGPGCCDYLAPVSAALADVFATIRFDARGCGRSSPAERYTLAGVLADLEAIRRDLGAERWVLAGHSAGADHALAYALAYPARTRAIVCLSGGRIHDDRSWHAEYRRGRDAGLEPDLDYAYPPNPEVNRQLDAEWKALTKRPSLLRELATLPAPALFVYGDRDIRPSWPCEQLAALLPRGEFRVLSGANHNLWLTQADELAGMLRDWISAAPR